MWKRHCYGLPKVIRWEHDSWILFRLSQKVKKPEQTRILSALILLQADTSIAEIAKKLNESPINIVGWLKTYCKSGLQYLLGIDITVPHHFLTAIERKIQEKPILINELLKLEKDSDFESYAEDIGVESYSLKNWIFNLELMGRSERIKHVSERKKGIARRSNFSPQDQ